MDTNNTVNRVIIVMVVIALVLVGWWLSVRSRAASPAVGSTTTGMTASSSSTAVGSTSVGAQAVGAITTTTSSGESLTVQNQAAGLSVLITSMHLTQPSWIAVRDNKSILGAGYFVAGAESGSVPLLRGTLASSTYTVVIYVDNGDHAFDFHNDSLVTDSSGTPVSATFIAE